MVGMTWRIRESLSYVSGIPDGIVPSGDRSRWTNTGSSGRAVARKAIVVVAALQMGSRSR